MAKAVSIIGTPSARIGTIKAIVAAHFTAPITEIPAKMKPRNMLPVSPMKILAGLKLYRKNPRAEPARAAVNRATTMTSCCSATRKIVMEAITATPAARPSRPSMRLTVLVSPTIQNTVAGAARYSRYRKSPKGSVMKSILTSK